MCVSTQRMLINIVVHEDDHWWFKHQGYINGFIQYIFSFLLLSDSEFEGNKMNNIVEYLSAEYWEKSLVQCKMKIDSG